MRTSTTTISIVLLIGGAAMSGCATRPFGMSAAEWNELSPQRQAEYRRLDSSEARRNLAEAEQTRRDAAETIKQAENRLPRMPD